jgi:sortase A
MKTKFGIGLISLGIVCIFSAFILLIWNVNESRQAEEAVEYIMPQLIDTIEYNASTPQQTEPEAMTASSIDGNDYIGVLSIPTCELDLPIMAQWSYPNLKIAPCRYSGSIQTHDLVIAAHNYSSHFGSLKSLQAGDKVIFTDMNDTVYTYVVTENEVLSPTAIEEMTSGDYDLTLFTCTYGGKSRVTVRCELVQTA